MREFSWCSSWRRSKENEGNCLCFFLKKKTRDQFLFIRGLVEGYGPLDLEPTL